MNIYEVINSIGAIFTSIGVVAAVWFSVGQIYAARKAIRAQSFLMLHQLEIASHGTEGLKAIANLKKKYNNYTDFEKNESKETQEAIYNAVAFLNFVATLSEEGYLKVQDAWDIYFMAYRISYENLWPWWLDHQREFHKNIFPSFERACVVTHTITPEMSDAYDEKMRPKYRERYKRASKLPKELLDKAISQTLNKPTQSQQRHEAQQHESADIQQLQRPRHAGSDAPTILQREVKN